MRPRCVGAVITPVETGRRSCRGTARKALQLGGRSGIASGILIVIAAALVVSKPSRDSPSGLNFEPRVEDRGDVFSEHCLRSPGKRFSGAGEQSMLSEAHPGTGGRC